MRYLFIIICCSFFFKGSLSAQITKFEWGERYSLANGYERPSFGVVVETEAGSEDGGGGIVNGTDCKTITSKISVTTVPYGSGFATRTLWRFTCNSGDQGTCLSGTYIEFGGCFDGELPEDIDNLTHIDCN